MHIQFETLCEKWVASGIQYSGEKFRGYFFEMKRSKIQIIRAFVIIIPDNPSIIQITIRFYTETRVIAFLFAFAPTKSVINKIVGRRPIDPARETMLVVESFSSVRWELFSRKEKRGRAKRRETGRARKKHRGGGNEVMETPGARFGEQGMRSASFLIMHGTKRLGVHSARRLSVLHFRCDRTTTPFRSSRVASIQTPPHPRRGLPPSWCFWRIPWNFVDFAPWFDEYGGQ